MEVCISNASVLLLKDTWAVHDQQLCFDCHNQIADDKPGAIIVDNDGFQNNTLTGGNISHCNKFLFKTVTLIVMNVLKMPKPYHPP